MSIYATLWAIKFPANGDFHTQCDWITVMGQGVPGHVGTPTRGHGYESGDPYSQFLPPAISIPEHDDGNALRAVVIVRAETAKIGQKYVHPLLTLSGEEYRALSFDALQRRICEALRGNKPRVIAEVSGERGSRLISEVSATKNTDRANRQERPLENE